MNSTRQLEALRKLQRLLDEAFRVPGTNLRFGLDPIIGLVPWAGDVITAILSCAIIIQAHRMRVPGVVQIRMMLNVAIDLVVGAVPFIGDVADVFWKSNTKNFTLLERHLRSLDNAGLARQSASGATAADWLFVIGLVSAVASFALVPLVVMYWLIQLLMFRAS